MTGSTDRTGVVVIRAWTESHQEPLRAVITSTLDVSRREHSVTTAKTVDEICAVVRRWLEEFLTAEVDDRDDSVTPG